MSDAPASPPDAPAETAAAAAPTSIALWPAEVIAQHLLSDDATIRARALGMALMPDAPVNDCVDELVKCVPLNEGDDAALAMAAAALGTIQPARATPAVHDALAALSADSNAVPVRVFAAHSMFRLACLPPAAADSVAGMLFSDDDGARKVALLALTPFASQYAGPIAAAVARTPATAWTQEGLAALARSAGNDGAAKRTVDAYVMRSLAGQPIVPTGIAGYLSLAQLNGGGSALAALVRIAVSATDAAQSEAALKAIGQLGDTASGAAPDVAQLLVTCDDPAREELLCRTLLQIKAPSRDIPLPRVVQRVGSAPERAAAAHCMLLCLHPKDFAPAAVAVRQRHASASDALKPGLAQAFKTLTGSDLVIPDTAQGA